MSELVKHAVPMPGGETALVSANMDKTIVAAKGGSLNSIGQYDDEFRDYLIAALSDWLTHSEDGKSVYEDLHRVDGKPIFGLSELMDVLGEENDLQSALGAWGILDLEVNILEPDDPATWEWNDQLLDEETVEQHRVKS